MLDTGQREGKQPVPLRQKATRPEEALQCWWWLAFPIALFFFLSENLLILQVHSHFYPWLSTPGKEEGKLRLFWATFSPGLRRGPGWVWMQVDVLGMDAGGCAEGAELLRRLPCISCLLSPPYLLDARLSVPAQCVSIPLRLPLLFTLFFPPFFLGVVSINKLSMLAPHNFLLSYTSLQFTRSTSAFL